MMIRKLRYMPYAQAHVEIDDEDNVYLFSYNTLVCEITHDNILSCFGLYSATTRKHISAFMREYTGFDYYMAKSAYEEQYSISLSTGEIIFWEEEEIQVI